jgi:Fe-S-cluster containining protein
MADLEQHRDTVRAAFPGDNTAKQCRKCGECCKKGGPALHREDLALVVSGKLPVSDLITIRKGELAYNPLTGKIQPASVELVKIVGAGGRWQCCYYDRDLGCTIYHRRPVGCRLLKCWDPDDILNLVEKDTLCRLDIITADDPFAALIKEHEKLCPCAGLQSILANRDSLTQQQKGALEARVERDLQFRKRVIEDFNLNLREEMFYFGRPFFQLLKPLGVRVVESKTGVQLIWAA